MNTSSTDIASLESVLRTDDLAKRPSRPPDYEAESRELGALIRSLVAAPESVLQTLAETILRVLHCGSAGVSLLKDDGESFFWPAVAGAWQPHTGGGTPRHFGPCGDVLDCNQPLMFGPLETRYTYFVSVTPPVSEALLVPFYMEGRAVGTVWAVTHLPDPPRAFDLEDLRLLTSLSGFASAAYQATRHRHYLQEEMIERQKVADALREVNEALLISSVRQHQLTELAEKAEHELEEHQHELEQRVVERTSDLVAAQGRLRLADRMAAVGTLAAGLAHDMKNLILPLGMRVDRVLHLDSLSGEVRADVMVISSLLDHLRAMAKNLTLFALDPEKEGVEGRTHLAPWSEQVRGFIDASAGFNVNITWQVPADVPPAGISPHRLTQAVLNLVHNARDAIVAAHTPAELASGKGRISVVARAAPASDVEKESVVVEVSDNGSGMTPEVKLRCLEPFYTTRDRPSVAGASGGTGLGLSMAHAIVDHIGGALEIDSTLDEGTTIRLRLPRARPEAAAVPTISPGRACVNVQDARLSSVMTQILERLHYEICQGPPTTPDVSAGEAAVDTDMWLTDTFGVTPKEVGSFLATKPGRRAIVIVRPTDESPDSWRSEGAETLSAATSLAELRSALASKSAR